MLTASAMPNFQLMSVYILNVPTTLIFPPMNACVISFYSAFSAWCDCVYIIKRWDMSKWCRKLFTKLLASVKRNHPINGSSFVWLIHLKLADGGFFSYMFCHIKWVYTIDSNIWHSTLDLYRFMLHSKSVEIVADFYARHNASVQQHYDIWVHGIFGHCFAFDVDSMGERRNERE